MIKQSGLTKKSEFTKTNPRLDFNLKPILKFESNAKLT